jgi:hypothetical protein
MYGKVARFEAVKVFKKILDIHAVSC